MANSTVSWQSAFWALVPLALNSMTQPCGQMFSLPAAHRTYLRSSPIICALDALAILVRLCVYMIKGSSPKAAASKIAEARFKAEMALADPGEGFQSLERLTLVRWIFFIVGTLPQAIKLFAMEGVPWTQVWGAMYLGSFAMVEIVVVLAGQALGLEYSPLPRTDQQDEDAARSEEILQVVDWLVSGPAIFLHIILLAWTWLQLCPQVIDAYRPFFLVVAYILDLFAALCLGISLLHPRADFVLFWVPVRFRSYTALFLGALFVGVVLGENRSTTSRSGMMRWAIEFNKKSGNLIILGSIVWILIKVIKVIARRSRTFQRKILLLSEDAIDRSEDSKNQNRTAEEIEDQDLTLLWPILLWLSFILTVLLSVLWYEIKYDPEGTLKPMWTDILG